jgi:hypothetical protein
MGNRQLYERDKNRVYMSGDSVGWVRGAVLYLLLAVAPISLALYPLIRLICSQLKG